MLHVRYYVQLRTAVKAILINRSLSYRLSRFVLHPLSFLATLANSIRMRIDVASWSGNSRLLLRLFSSTNTDTYTDINALPHGRWRWWSTHTHALPLYSSCMIIIQEHITAVAPHCRLRISIKQHCHSMSRIIIFIINTLPLHTCIHASSIFFFFSPSSHVYIIFLLFLHIHAISLSFCFFFRQWHICKCSFYSELRFFFFACYSCRFVVLVMCVIHINPNGLNWFPMTSLTSASWGFHDYCKQYIYTSTYLSMNS